MNVAPRNPITDLRASTGYTIEELSVVSGLTVIEIMKIESGELIDPAKVTRLFAAAGLKQA